MRSAFVVAQVSLSLVLVFVGGLFTRALQQASSTNAGFDARGVEVASIDASLGRDGDAAGPSVARELLDRVRHIPGVASASMSRMLPLANEAMGMGLSLPGEVPRPGEPAQTPAVATSSRRAISPRCGFRYAPGATSPARTLRVRLWWLSSVRLPLVDSGRARIRSGSS
jgi:hypothetical protein